MFDFGRHGVSQAAAQAYPEAFLSQEAKGRTDGHGFFLSLSTQTLKSTPPWTTDGYHKVVAIDH